MYSITVGETEYNIEPIAGDSLKGKVNGNDYQLDLTGKSEAFHVIHKHRSYQVDVVKADLKAKSFVLMVNNNLYELDARDRFDLLLEELGMSDLAAGAVNDLKAPMPGLVLSVEVEEGQQVAKGEPLLVLEAMKMENVLKAEQDAVVKGIGAEIGQAVEKNQVLIEFEA